MESNKLAIVVPFSWYIKAFFFLLIICIAFEVYGQKIDFKYNEHLWNEITLADRNDAPQTSDTMLVICTVRGFDSLSLRLFNDQIDPSSSIQYLLVVRIKQHWIVYRMSSLNEAASFLRRGNDVVFYIEGMGKTFTTNLYRGAGLALQYGVNVVLFDYPSADPAYSLLRNFRLARKNSSKVYLQYVNFICAIRKNKDSSSIWIKSANTTLFHHSMGNRMLERAVRVGAIQNLPNSLFQTIVLNAPCVPERHHVQWLNKIKAAPEVLVIYNKQDSQLKAAGWYTFRRQLGNSPTYPSLVCVKYINLNRLAGRKHNVFLNRPGGTPIHPLLHSFYNGIFHGLPVSLEQ